MIRTVVVAVAWLTAMAGALGLIVAASSGTALTGGGPGLYVVFGGLALAVATDASVRAVLLLRQPGNIVGLVLILAAVLLAVTFPVGFVFAAVLTEQRGMQPQIFALAGSTLVTLALFQPVRHVQSVVERCFNRSHYDAQPTVEGCAVDLRDEFDLERVGSELGAAVGEAQTPTSVGVWLRPSLRISGR